MVVLREDTKLIILIKKELTALARSTLFYVTSALLIVSSAYLFSKFVYQFNLSLAEIQAGKMASIQTPDTFRHIIAPYISSIVWIQLLLIPMLISRIVLLDRQQGSLEVLLLSGNTKLKMGVAKLTVSLLTACLFSLVSFVFPFLLALFDSLSALMLCNAFCALLIVTLAVTCISFALSLFIGDILITAGASMIVSFGLLIGASQIGSSQNSAVTSTLAAIVKTFSPLTYSVELLQGIFSLSVVSYCSLILLFAFVVLLFSDGGRAFILKGEES